MNRPRPPWAALASLLLPTPGFDIDGSVRERIHDHVVSYPGLHLSEIARELELDTNHVKYHLEVLETQGFVSSRRTDGYWRFFPREPGKLGTRDVLDVEEKDLLSVLRRKIPLRVTLILLQEEELRHGRIAERLGVAGATAHYHLKRMQRRGVLESRRDGRTVRYRLADPRLVAELLTRYEPPEPILREMEDAWRGVEPLLRQMGQRRDGGGPPRR